MTKKQKIVKRPPLWIVITMILSMFVGIFTLVIGVSNIQHYNHPYWFGLLTGSIGLMIGLFTAKKAKPYIAVNPELRRDYGMAKMYISTGFIGIFLLLGTIINKELSVIETRDNFLVVNKYIQEARFRSPEIKLLIVNIKGDTHRLVCNPDYWDNIGVGQSIELCIYKSRFGFDFFEIADEQKASR